MEFANDANGVRTPIYRANKNQKYYCPCCGEQMIQKRGSVIKHHFAHKSLENCVSYYDNKGEWHREMQDLFPEDNREIFNNECGKHIFDVLTHNGRIIEFQNSPMSIDEFWKRTGDYVSHTIKHDTPRMIWVFNYINRNFYVVGRTQHGGTRRRKIRWYRPTSYVDEYREWEASFGLWFRIRPLLKPPESTYVCTNNYGEHYVSDYAHQVFGCKYLDSYYVRISSMYDDCKYVYGDVYTEEEFKKLIINF